MMWRLEYSPSKRWSLGSTRTMKTWKILTTLQSMSILNSRTLHSKPWEHRNRGHFEIEMLNPQNELTQNCGYCFSRGFQSFVHTKAFGKQGLEHSMCVSMGPHVYSTSSLHNGNHQNNSLSTSSSNFLKFPSTYNILHIDLLVSLYLEYTKTQSAKETFTYRLI